MRSGYFSTLGCSWSCTTREGLNCRHSVEIPASRSDPQNARASHAVGYFLSGGCPGQFPIACETGDPRPGPANSLQHIKLGQKSPGATRPLKSLRAGGASKPLHNNPEKRRAARTHGPVAVPARNEAMPVSIGSRKCRDIGCQTERMIDPAVVQHDSSG